MSKDDPFDFGDLTPTKRAPRCRGCSNPVGADEAVKIGGFKYHPDCAAKKPRSRQEWTGNGWKHLGYWSDEEQATMEAHSG